MLQKIRQKIKSKSSMESFAKEHGIRRATLSDFLLQKIDIRFSSLEKIITPLGFEISEKLPGKFIEVQSIHYKNKKFKKDMLFGNNQKIVFCFGCTETTYQALILQNTSTNEFELKIL